MRYPFITALSLAVILPSCETLNQPLTEGRISPLDTAGTQRKLAARQAAPAADGLGGLFRPGEKVTTNSPSTPFFKSKPTGNAMADQMLPLNEELKFIADEESYFKVQTKKGEVGYVPALMVSMPMIEDLPPLPGIIDLPELPPAEDPGGLPPLPDPDALDDPTSLPDLPDPDAPDLQ